MLSVRVTRSAYPCPFRSFPQVPLDFERGSGKKGVLRYHTPVVKDLLAELAEAEAEKEDALKGIFRKLLQHFCRCAARPLTFMICWSNGLLHKVVLRSAGRGDYRGCSRLCGRPLCSVKLKGRLGLL